MRFSKTVLDSVRWGRTACLGGAVLALAACGGSDTHPQMPAAPEVDASGQPIIEAGDVAIAGQLVAHSLMDLPEVADATVPPLVRFSGVVSAVNGPVDTEPYTTLLRDRLLLITREKLRFVERVLPPLTSYKGHKHHAASPDLGEGAADDQILAQLRGNLGDDTYLIRIQFVDLHSSQTLFDGLYRIHKELPEPSPGNPEGQEVPQQPAAPPNSDIESTAPNPAQAPAPDPNVPLPPPNDTSSFQ